MTNKLPTINIKGKEYVMVKDRILAFNESNPNGCIQTSIVPTSDPKNIIVKAKVTPDIKFPERYFTDYSQAVIGQGLINQTSALENASTSAVGRALAYMGIGVIESIASADEVIKAEKMAGQESKSVVYIEGGVCPKDGGRLIKAVTKAGKEFMKCENNKWDAENQKNIGCDYVNWEMGKVPTLEIPDNE